MPSFIKGLMISFSNSVITMLVITGPPMEESIIDLIELKSCFGACIWNEIFERMLSEVSTNSVAIIIFA